MTLWKISYGPTKGILYYLGLEMYDMFIPIVSLFL